MADEKDENQQADSVNPFDFSKFRTANSSEPVKKVTAPTASGSATMNPFDFSAFVTKLPEELIQELTGEQQEEQPESQNKDGTE